MERLQNVLRGNGGIGERHGRMLNQRPRKFFL